MRLASNPIRRGDSSHRLPGPCADEAPLPSPYATPLLCDDCNIPPEPSSDTSPSPVEDTSETSLHFCGRCIFPARLVVGWHEMGPSLHLVSSDVIHTRLRCTWCGTCIQARHEPFVSVLRPCRWNCGCNETKHAARPGQVRPYGTKRRRRREGRGTRARTTAPGRNSSGKWEEHLATRKKEEKR